MENQNREVVLSLKGVRQYFQSGWGKNAVSVKAVHNVSFDVYKGEVFGLVGESGCGKTTLGRTILQLYDTTGGKTLYYGHTVEEKLPKYYIKEVKALSKYKSKFTKLYNELKDLLGSDNKICDLNSVTLENLNKYLDEETFNLNSLKDKSETNETIVKLEKVTKTLKDIIDLLENASETTGGLILSETSKTLPILLSKLYNENKLINRNISINKISKRVKFYSRFEVYKKKYNEMFAEIEKTPLFLELENKKESGLDLARLTKKELRLMRPEIQLIFQDPYSSLPPRMTIGSILKEPVTVHKVVSKDKVNEHVRHIMKVCGLQPQYYDRYPHEFSGGQRQRICIARALVVNPKLVICDEPVSALDVSIQAQIINLLKELQNNLGLTYMFISHDLSVVKYITDSIIVMYLGNMMEIGNTKDIFDNPLHPYTKALFSAVPVPDPDAKMNRIILKGDIPSPANPPKGCKFHTRCEKCMNVCKFKVPEFIEYEDNHLVACHLYNKEVMENLALYDTEYEAIVKAEKALEESKDK